MTELDDFLRDQRKRGNSPATVAHYELVLGKFLEATGLGDLSQLDEDLVSQWRLDLLARVKPESVRTYEKAVRVWCNWLVRRGSLEASPYRDLPKVRVPRSKGYRGFSAQDVDAMLRVVERKGRVHRLRDRAVIAVLLDTGMRVGELASIELRDVLWTDRMVRVMGKTGGRAVPARTSLRYVQRYISHERRALPGVERLVTSRTGLPMSAQGLTTSVRRTAEEAGVQADKLGPHTFRHTFAMEYLKSGGDLFSLMRILGHSNVKTTEKYVQWLVGDVAELHAHHSPASRWLR